MAKLNFTVDAKRCTGCGLCVRDCVTQIIKQNVGKVPTVALADEANCLECQHCLAICPTAAISIFGLNPDAGTPLNAQTLPTFAQLSTLIRGRRSVRHYRDQNVDAATIRKILEASAHSPTGCNNRSLTFTLIDDKATLAKFRETTYTALEQARTTHPNPDALEMLWDGVTAYRKLNRDDIFRGAPHMLFVSVGPDAPCAHEDVVIALAEFELLATAEGLGTVWCGYVKFAMEAATPELKDILGIPRDHAVYPMLFGLPAVHYARTIQRNDGATIRSVKL